MRVDRAILKWDSMSTLEVVGLTVDFPGHQGGRFRAVDAVSFKLVAGRTVALVGESGSGKSTVVRALGRLVRPTSGELFLDEERVGRWRDLARYRRHVQVVFQDPFASLNPSHSIGYHLKRPLLLHHRVRRDGVKAAVADLLRSVNLGEDVVEKFPHELSGGERQRVAIARALAPSPGVLLADEPISMLDVSVRLEILRLLDELKQERSLALLYVTHDLATAWYFSSEVMVMYRGEIVERGSADDVILRPRHPYTQLLASAAPSPNSSPEALALARRERREARARQRAGPVRNLEGLGCRFRERCPFAAPVCDKRPPELKTDEGHLVRCWLYGDKVSVGGLVTPANNGLKQSPPKV